MGILTRSFALLVAVTAFAPIASASQTHLSVTLETGPLFTGVGFSTASYHDAGSVFLSASLGTYYGTRYRSRSSAYDYGHRTPAPRNYVTVRASCWDSYWESYWDPFGGWYVECLSFRAKRWRHGWAGYSVYRAPRHLYVSRPYVVARAPYWAYDPWTSYWSGYQDGYVDGRWSRRYAPRPVRTVYAYGGRRGVASYRPSPLAGSFTRYKESPASRAGSRTAVRRAGAASAAPSGTRIAQDRSTATGRPSGRIAAPSRFDNARVRSASGSGARADAGPAARSTPSNRARARPSGRVVRPEATERGSASRASEARPAARATPSTRERPSARVAPRSEERPSTRATPRAPSRPSARVAPSQGRRPSDRAAPSSSSGGDRRPTVAPRGNGRAPAARATPRDGRPRANVRSEPRSTPSTRSRPSTRSAPESRRAVPSRPSRGSAPSGAVRSDRGERPSVSRRSAPSRAEPRRDPSAGSRPSSRSSGARSTPSAGSRPSSRSPEARSTPSRGSSRGSAPSRRPSSRRPGGPGSL